MARPIQINFLNGLLSAVAAILFYLPVAIIAAINRIIMRIIVKVKFGASADLLTPSDCSTIVKAMRTADSLLVMVLEVQGEAKLETLRHRFKTTLVDARAENGALLHPKLSSTFEYFHGYRIYYPCKTFDIGNHFNVILDAEGSPLVVETDKEFEDAVEQVANSEIFPQDRLAPRWRFHVFYRKRPTTSNAQHGNMETVILMHIDHCFLDGGAMSLVILPKLFDMDPASDPSVLFQHMKAVSSFQRAWLCLSGFLMIPLALFRAYFVNGFWPSDLNPIHARRGKMDGRYILRPIQMPLKMLKDIQASSGAKLNTILASCIYKALQRISQDIAADPKTVLGCKKDAGILEKLQMRSTRERNWTLVIPQSCWVPGDKLELVNRTSGLLYSMKDTELTRDRMETLRTVKHTFEDPSRMMYSWSMFNFGSTLINCVPLLISDLAFAGCKNFTGVFSNVRGPDVKQTLIGHELLAMTAYVSMWENLDLGVVANSYNGNLGIQLAGRKGSFRSREELRTTLEYIKEEVHMLHQSVIKKVA